MRTVLLVCAFTAFAIGSAAKSKTSYRPVGISPALRSQYEAALSELAGGRTEAAANLARLGTLPDHIYVQFEGPAPCVQAGRNALSNWNVTLGTDLFVEDATRSTVTVHFQNDVFYGSERVAGLNSWTRELDSYGFVVIYGQIQVATKLPWGRSLSKSQIEKTTMHELGHLLGLPDESSSDQMMGPLAADRETRAQMPEVESILEYARQMKQLADSIRPAPVSRVPKIYHLKEG